MNQELSGELSLLGQIVRREAALAQTSPSVSGLATTLLDHIVLSQSFGWMGIVVDGQTAQAGASAHFYLSELAPEKNSGDLNELRSSLPDIFDALALALEPEVVAELRITNERTTPLSELKSEIERYCGIDPDNRKLIWEQSLELTS